MRLWHLSSNRWNSAITEFALCAAQALARRGHETLFTPLADSPAELRSLELGLSTQSLVRFTGMQLGEARGMAHDFSPDLIFTYGGPETFLSRFLGVPVVRVRGNDLAAESALAGPMQRLAHAHVAAVVAPSRALAEKIRKVLPRTPVAAITLGCDPERFYRIASSVPTAPVAVIFGRFDPVKGHVPFMRIWRRVRDLVPGARLRIVGEPANLSVTHLERAATLAGLALGADVTIEALRVHNVAALLSGAAVGVVPSIGSEIIGRVAEEFLLCGTPVLVSGVGCLDEVIVDASFGATWRGLGEEATAVLVADWLRRAIHETEATKSQRATQAEARFSLAAMGEELERLIHSC